uniref:Uncharacterized protein n=1 Tax=Nelumbo nucifera TaxID=4432 RepID=A0A822XUF3_NELNU|nr:TPA_asm: hypothetical protein HUJ06_024192 [Nelumbo nucifera]
MISRKALKIMFTGSDEQVVQVLEGLLLPYLLMQMQSLPEILLRSYKMADKSLVQHWLQWPGQVVLMVEVQGGTSAQGDGDVVVLTIELVLISGCNTVPLGTRKPW